MIEQAGFWSTYWWIFPLGMMLLCIFGRRGSGRSCMAGWGDDSDREESSREILNRRYASGEIDKAEYEEMKNTISSNR
jgi:uncharacterized membrane protein